MDQNYILIGSSAAPQRRVSRTAEPGCGTAYPVTFVQQHLYMI